MDCDLRNALGSILNICITFEQFFMICGIPKSDLASTICSLLKHVTNSPIILKIKQFKSKNVWSMNHMNMYLQYIYMPIA